MWWPRALSRAPAALQPVEAVVEEQDEEHAVEEEHERDSERLQRAPFVIVDDGGGFKCASYNGRSFGVLLTRARRRNIEL